MRSGHGVLASSILGEYGPIWHRYPGTVLYASRYSSTILPILSDITFKSSTARFALLLFWLVQPNIGGMMGS